MLEKSLDTYSVDSQLTYLLLARSVNVAMANLMSGRKDAAQAVLPK